MTTVPLLAACHSRAPCTSFPRGSRPEPRGASCKTSTALIGDTATEGDLDFSAKMRRIVVQAGETNRNRAGSPDLECLATTEPAFRHAEHVAPQPKEWSAAAVIDIDIMRCSVDLQLRVFLWQGVDKMRLAELDSAGRPAACIKGLASLTDERG